MIKRTFHKAWGAMREESEKQFGFFRSSFSLVLIAALFAIPIYFAAYVIEAVEMVVGLPGYFVLLAIMAGLGVVIGWIIRAFREHWPKKEIEDEEV